MSCLEADNVECELDKECDKDVLVDVCSTSEFDSNLPSVDASSNCDQDSNTNEVPVLVSQVTTYSILIQSHTLLWCFFKQKYRFMGCFVNLLIIVIVCTCANFIFY